MNFTVKTSKNSFSQLNLETGDKILISITKSEVAILKVAFLGIPTKTIWKKSLGKFMKDHMIVPQSVFGSLGERIINEIKAYISKPECKKLEDIPKILEK